MTKFKKEILYGKEHCILEEDNTSSGNGISTWEYDVASLIRVLKAKGLITDEDLENLR